MRSSMWVAVVAALTLLVLPARGRAAAPPELTAADLSTWLDGLMPYALKSGDIPGAVVVVVKDGNVLVEKGYGLADVAARKPVDPKTTLFRPGSISKTFTWTSVMQLVEAGKVDLDADVNRYIDFHIPDLHGRPVTLRNLMTHTAGFEEASKGLLVEDAQHMPSLAVLLKRWVPRRIFEAGSTPAYSNYGAALAGYIVQRVSGEPFDVYVARHILAPLEMGRSSFSQPLSADLRASMSQGYSADGRTAKPYEFSPMAPAGALAATGDDMGRYMIAQLQDGRYGPGSILQPATARRMQRTVAHFTPPLLGAALGFFEANLNGHEVISHGGDTLYFHSGLWLFVDDGIGLFVSLNGAGKPGASSAIRQNLFVDFADRYLPAAPAAPDPAKGVDPATARAHAKAVSGLYQPSRRAQTTFASLGNLFGGLTVTALPDGTILALRKHYREVAPWLWREIDGHDRLAAVVRDGRVVRVANDLYGYGIVFTPMPFGTSPAWLAPADGAALLFVAATVALWPLVALIRHRYGRGFALEGARAHAYRAVRASLLVVLAAAAAWFVILGAVEGPSGPADVLVLAAELLTLLGLLLAWGAAAFNLRPVWRRGAGVSAKAFSLVLVAALAPITWTAVAFHLIGLGTNY